MSTADQNNAPNSSQGNTPSNWVDLGRCRLYIDSQKTYFNILHELQEDTGPSFNPHGIVHEGLWKEDSSVIIHATPADEHGRYQTRYNGWPWSTVPREGRMISVDDSQRTFGWARKCLSIQPKHTIILDRDPLEGESEPCRDVSAGYHTISINGLRSALQNAEVAQQQYWIETLGSPSIWHAWQDPETGAMTYVPSRGQPIGLSGWLDGPLDGQRNSVYIDVDYTVIET
ncbi:uncharacterized protein I303_105331 [Kwoniella dejecticola CBS 10117]|uniref:Uncharacterized protein n=1 Tax=Kwoniella dejecticola CBS 10117 TaxID=1296121 RepID=A0A1A6A2T1_9TREE|nr:uncharacterized protein I303_05222 [Kwoniella dejecticola CBS 10117]OBR84364.1 hypothetical protein I303_05222 [Kwoniella dejecticola CBS 10117]